MKKIIIAGSLLSAFAQAGELPVASPESQGFDSAKLANLVQVIEREGWAIDSVLLMRNGKVVLDSYFYPYAPNQLHDMRSVTKSVVSTLLGLSITQRKLSNLQQAVLPFYPARQRKEQDEDKKRLSLENLVDMRSGLQWNEWPYTEDSTIYQMYRSQDQHQFVIGLPLVTKPGAVFNYNGGNMNLLSGVVEKAWGEPMAQVASKALFAKLGITDFRWASDPQGHTIGESALYLKPHDMARLGQFWLDDGVIAQERLLPTGWTSQLLAEGLPAVLGMQYRRGFWISPNQQTFQAQGRHGQMIVVAPQQKIVLVVTGKMSERKKEWYDLYPLLTPSLSEGALPENPAAQAKLKAVTERIAQPKPDENTIKLGRQWLGKKWQLSDNPTGMTAFEITADPNDTGALLWRVDWQNKKSLWNRSSGTNHWRVGLDGAYRFQRDPSANGETLALRAKWLDPETLTLEAQYPTGGGVWEYQMQLSGDTLSVELNDNEAFATQFTGRIQAKGQ
ncbi:serine hydrolase [Chitinibacter sp. SCUT-21]|uniref:serine hydrolase n=1 Tax=Chitinibacter sp. SCUT-21 TaxID=2970891 RepID=UPI0035A5BAD2